MGQRLLLTAHCDAKFAWRCGSWSRQSALEALEKVRKTPRGLTVRHVCYVIYSGCAAITPRACPENGDQSASRSGRGSRMGGAVIGLGGGSPIGVSPGGTVGTDGGVGGSVGCGRCMELPYCRMKTQVRHCRQCYVFRKRQAVIETV